MANRRSGALGSITRDRSILQQKVAPGTFRRILGFARQWRWLLALFLVLVILDAAFTAANPLIYRQIINRGILGNNEHLIITLTGLVVAIGIADALETLWQRYIAAKIASGITLKMRNEVFAHIQSMSLAFFTRTQTGALISRLNNDVVGARDAFTDFLSNVVGNTFNVALTLGAMFYLSWHLTIVALVVLPIFILPAQYLGRKLQVLTRENYDLLAEMNNLMTERFNVAGAMLAKIFGRPAEEERQFNDKAGRVHDITIKISTYSRFFYIALGFVATITIAAIYGWGGIQVLHGVLDIGTVVALTAYLGRLYGPLTALSNVQVDVMTTLVSFERVFEILDLKPMVAEKPDAVAIPQLPGTAAGIIFQDVSFRYPTATEVSLASLESVAVLSRAPEKEVLKDISFVCQPGQLTALVGPSGAGKTTITQLVARFYDPQSGSVSINGIDLRDATLDSIHSLIGIVTQEAHMFHDTIRANLSYAKPGAGDEEIFAALRAAQILPLVESLPQGLDTVLGDRGYRLSGGEKQRLAIARVMLKAPQVIVLDEATAHLDSASEHAVQEAFKAALAGRTSLVIAHRLSTIQNADQILVVEHGNIVERGTHPRTAGCRQALRKFIPYPVRIR